jgi:hypothetical protein
LLLPSPHLPAPAPAPYSRMLDDGVCAASIG